MLKNKIAGYVCAVMAVTCLSLAVLNFRRGAWAIVALNITAVALNATVSYVNFHIARRYR